MGMTMQMGITIMAVATTIMASWVGTRTTTHTLRSALKIDRCYELLC